MRTISPSRASVRRRPSGSPHHQLAGPASRSSRRQQARASAGRNASSAGLASQPAPSGLASATRLRRLAASSDGVPSCERGSRSSGSQRLVGQQAQDHVHRLQPGQGAQEHVAPPHGEVRALGQRVAERAGQVGGVGMADPALGTFGCGACCRMITRMGPSAGSASSARRLRSRSRKGTRRCTRARVNSPGSSSAVARRFSCAWPEAAEVGGVDADDDRPTRRAPRRPAPAPPSPTKAMSSAACTSQRRPGGWCPMAGRTSAGLAHRSVGGQEAPGDERPGARRRRRRCVRAAPPARPPRRSRSTRCRGRPTGAAGRARRAGRPRPGPRPRR